MQNRELSSAAAMDQAQLAVVIQRAEEIGAELPDFLGLSLGQIYTGSPEEIYSGRVVARARTYQRRPTRTIP